MVENCYFQINYCKADVGMVWRIVSAENVMCCEFTSLFILWLTVPVSRVLGEWTMLFECHCMGFSCKNSFTIKYPTWFSDLCVYVKKKGGEENTDKKKIYKWGLGWRESLSREASWHFLYFIPIILAIESLLGHTSCFSCSFCWLYLSSRSNSLKLLLLIL